MSNPVLRDLVVRESTRLRAAYDLLADVRNLSTCLEIRAILGQDAPELEAACTWLKRQMRRIQCSLGHPTCIECGCPMGEDETVCTVCEWQKGSP